ncbi:MAG: peroxidase [Chloroflexota bacterium]|nr:peroxidase [Chloroflexota bacterium]
MLRLTKDEDTVEQLSGSWRAASLSPRQTAMLAYAEKLTLTPAAMLRGDVIALRDAGFSDRDVLDINQIVGYFAYVNRLADGLGVPLEEFWDAPE